MRRLRLIAWSWWASGKPEDQMRRTLALIERELRRFRRSPTLIVVSMIFPVVQLVVLGYAFGGNVKRLRLGVVDQDHGVPAVRLRELAGAVAANARTFEPLPYHDAGEALSDLRNGRINGVLTIPPEFSRRALVHRDPQVALIEDNTDNFVSNALAAALTGLVGAYNRPAVTSDRTPGDVTLEVVEIYPYVPYIQYLLPGTIAMSIFMMVMIGGGIIFIDDKARGLHEVFQNAGFEWRGAGCSMCLGMNPDRLEGRQICASSSNRNFKGRMGSPTGRTLLMSPAMVAAAAIAGEIVDVRQMLAVVPA